MVSKSALELTESLGEGAGIERRVRAGRGGDEEPGIGSLGDSPVDPGEWEERSELPSDPRLSCLLSG